MPQMAPIMWSYLFLFFILSFFVFSFMNYFNKPYGPKLTLGHDSHLHSKSWKL